MGVERMGSARVWWAERGNTKQIVDVFLYHGRGYLGATGDQE